MFRKLVNNTSKICINSVKRFISIILLFIYVTQFYCMKTKFALPFFGVLILSLDPTLAAGIYFIKIYRQNGQIETVKLVKQ